MPTAAQMRRMRWIERWMETIFPRVVRRVLNGEAPQPGWLPRRWLTVVSADVDVEVPGPGRLIVAWKSGSTGCGGVRPLIVAVGRDGSELSRIGPHDGVDSYTWATLARLSG
jgi:hypothetical protein